MRKRKKAENEIPGETNQMANEKKTSRYTRKQASPQFPIIVDTLYLDVSLELPLLFLLLFVVFSFVSGQFLMPSYRWTQKGDFLSKTIYGAFLLSRISGLSIQIFSIEQSVPRIPSKKTTLSTGCADRIARSKKKN